MDPVAVIATGATIVSSPTPLVGGTLGADILVESVDWNEPIRALIGIRSLSLARLLDIEEGFTWSEKLV